MPCFRRSCSALSTAALRRALLVVALGLCFTAAQAVTLELAVASAQSETERARAEFGRGVEAYGRGEFQSALDAFQEAYRLAPHPTVRVNIANCYEQLGRPLEALHHFETFLSESASPSRAQRREVQTAIGRLSARVGQLELQISPDGATVTIDGTITRRAPVTDMVRVEAGRHTVQVALSGFVTTDRAVEVPGGGRARVDVRLERPVVASAGGASGGGSSGSASGPGSTSGSGSTSGGSASGGSASGGSASGSGSTSGSGVASSEGGGSGATSSGSGGEMRVVSGDDDGTGQVDDGGGDFRITTPVWIAGGITIAAGIGAAITGVLALVANDDFEYNVGVAQDPSSTPAEIAIARQDGQAAADSARTMALVSDVLLITTIIGAGATTFFLITTQEGGVLGDMASARGPTFMAMPLAAPGFGGVGVSGSF